MVREQPQRERQMRALATQAVRDAVRLLYVELPFLDAAVFRLRFEPDESGTVDAWSANGGVAFYSPQHVLETYRQGAGELAHEVLHIVLHCVFRHMFVDPGIDHELWGTACDTAVEVLIDSLGVPGIADGRESERGAYSALLFDAPKAITAERVYRSLADGTLSEADTDLLGGACYVDEHLWYGGADGDGAGDPADEQGEQDAQQEGADDAGEGEPEQVEVQQAAARTGGDGDRQAEQQLREEWERAARSVQAGLESALASQTIGANSGKLLQALRALNRRRYDYRKLLRAFTSWDEQVQSNEEEFDYIYYTLGLERYGDMPLIEPLEYRELKRLRDVAIVIDTSGSVAGDALQRLFERTYDLISEQSSAGRRFRIHLIQCDAQVKRDTVLHSREDMEQALREFEFEGLGGTDFRPAFAYVDDLVAQGAFVNFKGVLYFTDGRGTFPERAPAYRTAFVFADEDLADARVPAWAIKAVLGQDDIREL